MKTLFLCGTPPHPIHELFAKAISADFYYFPDKGTLKEKKESLFRIPKDYDIYFSEGLFGYLYLLRKLNKISRKKKLVNLFSDPRLFQLLSREKFDFKKNKVARYSKSRRLFQKKAVDSLDYAICIGKYQTELLRQLNKKIKILTVPPMIERKAYFKKEVSNLRNNNIFFLGGGPDYNYKGLDLLINIFSEVNKEFPESKLYIIGSGWERVQNRIKNKNILFVGRKTAEQMIEIMKDCSLCCHFGRGEATGISILEAMLKGLPSIVSNETGAKEYVSKVDKNFVVDIKKREEIVKSIKNYFNLELKKKQQFGKKFRGAVLHLTKENAIQKFKEEFGKILHTT